MERSLNDTTEVLIVGAGPTGLMMACQLALHKVTFRIIDKNITSSQNSGALIVQARTLEIFEQNSMFVYFTRIYRMVSVSKERTLGEEFDNSCIRCLGGIGFSCLSLLRSIFPDIFDQWILNTHKSLTSYLYLEGFCKRWQRVNNVKKATLRQPFFSLIL